MKKRLLAAAMCGALLVSLAACGNTGTTNQTGGTGGTDTTTGSATAENSTSTKKDVEKVSDIGAGVKIIWGNYGSSQMPPNDANETAIEYWESNGFEVDYQPDAVLGGEADMMQQIMDGTIQCASLTTGTFSLYSTDVEVFQLPFLIGDYDTEKAALTSDEARAILEKIDGDMGIKIIPESLTENGIRHFATNKKPIETLADLKGVKLRIGNSQMLQDAMQKLGASPVAVAYNDVYSSLQNGVIDGEEINITSAYALKHYEQLKYISKIGMYPYPQWAAFNGDFWNSLTEEQQQVIIDGLQLGSDKEFESYLPDYETKAEDEIAAYGIEINEITGDARQEFVDAVQPVWESKRAESDMANAFIDKALELSK